MAILQYKWLLPVLWLLTGYPSGYSVPSAARAHPLYVTVTEINHNAKDKVLEISCKIFTDDFEKTLVNTYKKKVDFSVTTESAETGKLVFEYIKTHLAIQLDGKAVKLEYVGYEKENDAVWSFFQVSNTANPPKKVSLTNSILYESYDKQMNLMHVAVGGNRKSTRLNYPDKETTLEF
jgi:hypothetical protein